MTDRSGAASLTASQRFDLRRVRVDDVLDRVEKSLQVRLVPEGMVRKRRSLGFRSDRGTWVRVECRGVERFDGQGWGLEATQVLRGIPVPTWHYGVSWHDTDRRVLWRADEIQRVDCAPVGRARSAAVLPDSWWAAFSSALDKLSQQPTTRLATPDCEAISAERVDASIRRIFPQVVVHVDEWATAHADLSWANVTGPELWILDWEDWGRAPRGLDAATLWFGSLAVPEVARNVYQRRINDLDSVTGQAMMLFRCAELLAWADDSEPLYAPARREAARLVTSLT